MLKLSSYMALGFGSFLAIAEAWRNWGNWQWWPFWVVDYIAAILLIIGAVYYLRTQTKSWLTGGWGFTAAMFWMSFFSHLHEQIDAQYGPDGNMNESQMTQIIGIMTAITFLGFILSLFGKGADKAD